MHTIIFYGVIKVPDGIGGEGKLRNTPNVPKSGKSLLYFI